jgi:hypothetical protein
VPEIAALPDDGAALPPLPAVVTAPPMLGAMPAAASSPSR